MSMSDNGIDYMLGYLNHQMLIDGVEAGYVFAADLKYHIERMDKKWGSYEGVLTFIRLYQEDRKLGLRFAKDMMEVTKNNGTTFMHLNDFDEDYTEEQWRNE